MIACRKILSLLIFTILPIVNSLDRNTLDEEEISNKASKYFDDIPSVEPKYIINEALSRLISTYFNGKINPFPLYRVSLKIDQKPVKIPWTLNQASPINEKTYKKKYKYIRNKKAQE